MTDKQPSGALFESWLKDTDPTPPDARSSVSRVMTQVPQTRQRGRWWPLPVFDRPMSTFLSRGPALIPATNGRTRPRGSTMFSALKFVVAGVIVALFGGFLLAGVLTTQQDGEVLPAVVTNSPPPMTSEELLAGMATEEVEPGLFRVINDGVRNLTPTHSDAVPQAVRVSPDGGVWLFGGFLDDAVFRLGEPGEYPWPEGADYWGPDVPADVADVEVAPHGTVWVLGDQPNGLSAFGGEAWTEWLPPDSPQSDGDRFMEVLSDGTVWATWGWGASRDITRFDGERWTVVEPPCGPLWGMHASDHDIWWVSGLDDDGCSSALYRYDGSRWQEQATPEGFIGLWPYHNRVGPDGTVWVSLRQPPEDWSGDEPLERRTGIARFDGTRWEEWGADDFPQDGVDPLRGTFRYETVAPDGSLWATTDECDGLARFDGESLTRYLAGYCIFSPDAAPDGSLWLVAAEGSSIQDPTGLVSLYVITPEAVAAKEAEIIEPPLAEEPDASTEVAIATEQLLSGMVTEEVEPGVYRVLDDGAGHVPGAIEGDHVMPRSLDRLHIEPDGSVWVMTTVYGDDWGKPDDKAVGWQVGVEGRYGQEDHFPGHEYPNRMPSDLTMATAPDGTLWAAGGWGLGSFDGDAWTAHGDGIWANTVSVLSDGTVWAAWPDRIGRLGSAGWEMFDSSDGVPIEVYQFAAAPDGRIFALGSGRLVGFDGAVWQDVRPLDDDVDTKVIDLRDAPDGTLWALLSDVTWSHDRTEPWLVRGLATDSTNAQQHYLAHFDGDAWLVYSPIDGVPRVSGPDPNVSGPDNGPNWDVHPDGSVWVSADDENAGSPVAAATLASFDGTDWTERFGAVERFTIGPDGSVWTITPEGVASFKDDEWTRYERPVGGAALDVAPDGTAWVLSNEDGHGLFVITPEAVVAKEEATVTESPPAAATTTEELLVGMVTEEVEPGVYRVINDGVRDLALQRAPTEYGLPSPAIVAGADGGIWVLFMDGYYRLGVDHIPGRPWHHRSFPDASAALLADFEVAPNGTIWAAIETSSYPDQALETSGHNLWSYDGEDWTVHRLTTPFDRPIEVTRDGTVWAMWLDDPGEEESRVFGYLGAEGWTTVGEWPFQFVSTLSVSDSGEVWAAGGGGWFGTSPHRFVDGAWREIGDYPTSVEDADVGPDGTLWGIGGDGAARFDGTGWMTFGPPDWMPTPRGDAGWVLVEDEWVFLPESDYEEAVERTFRASFWGEPHVAPDGALWVPTRLGVWGDQGQPICDLGVDGVARHDGSAWSRYLQRHCIEAMDIAADGSVWLLATESGARYPLLRTYVITREAVAATG